MGVGFLPDRHRMGIVLAAVTTHAALAAGATRTTSALTTAACLACAPLTATLDGKSVFCVFELGLDSHVFLCICTLADAGQRSHDTTASDANLSHAHTYVEPALRVHNRRHDGRHGRRRCGGGRRRSRRGLALARRWHRGGLADHRCDVASHVATRQLVE